jgi:hypothetical protein
LTQYSSFAQNAFPATGNVGIGTATPSYNLQINSPSGIPFQINGTNASWTGMYMNNSTATGQPFYGFQNPSRSAWTYMKPNGDWALNASGERLIVSAATGNVGIGLGTASPSYKLHIISPDTRAFQIDGTSTGYTGMYINSTSGTGLPFYGYITNGNYAWTYLDPTGNWRLVNGSERLAVLNNGNVLINKSSQLNPLYKLDVNGTIRANEIVVNTTGADFVFEDNYKLLSLNEVENFIKVNKHLPSVPSAEEMTNEGMSVAKQSTILL